jgi:ABC-type transport system involved in multi-copper enzyme maturation permease subunit
MRIVTIARLTIRETQRRRILWIGTLMGIAFLVVFGLGFHFVYVDINRAMSPEEFRTPFLFMTMAGLYATNFLVIMVSVLISVATVSGEIESHTVESLLTKPMDRWELIIGKWLGYALIILLYVLLLPGGVLLIVYLRSGFTLSNIPYGLALIYMEGLIGLSISIAGGTRLSTLANGALAFMLFGIAFIGGWVEQIGALFRNETAVDLGIVSSLLMPTETLWRKATTIFEPQIGGGMEIAGPFIVAAQPSDAMVGYSVLYIIALLALALWLFARRDI